MDSRGQHPPPGGSRHAVRGISGTVRPGTAAAGSLCRRTGQRGLCPGGPARGRSPRRQAGGGAPWKSPSGNTGRVPTAGACLQPPLPGLPPPSGQEFRGPRRGHSTGRHPEQRPGGIRQRRAAETLLDPGHGTQPGQAFQPQWRSNPGPAQRKIAGGDRTDHGPSLHQPGALESSGRAHLQPPAPNPAARPPPATGRAFHGCGKLAAAGILPGPGSQPAGSHPGGSRGRSPPGGCGRRGHPGQAGNLRPGRGGLHGKDVHGAVCQVEGREKPLRPDVRRERNDGG